MADSPCWSTSGQRSGDGLTVSAHAVKLADILLVGLSPVPSWREVKASLSEKVLPSVLEMCPQ